MDHDGGWFSIKDVKQTNKNDIFFTVHSVRMNFLKLFKFLFHILLILLSLKEDSQKLIYYNVLCTKMNETIYFSHIFDHNAISKVFNVNVL